MADAGASVTVAEHPGVDLNIENVLDSASASSINISAETPPAPTATLLTSISPGQTISIRSKSPAPPSQAASVPSLAPSFDPTSSLLQAIRSPSPPASTSNGVNQSQVSGLLLSNQRPNPINRGFLGSSPLKTSFKPSPELAHAPGDLETSFTTVVGDKAPKENEGANDSEIARGSESSQHAERALVDYEDPQINDTALDTNIPATESNAEISIVDSAVHNQVITPAVAPNPIPSLTASAQQITQPVSHGRKTLLSLRNTIIDSSRSIMQSSQQLSLSSSERSGLSIKDSNPSKNLQPYVFIDSQKPVNFAGTTNVNGMTNLNGSSTLNGDSFIRLMNDNASEGGISLDDPYLDPDAEGEEEDLTEEVTNVQANEEEQRVVISVPSSPSRSRARKPKSTAPKSPPKPRSQIKVGPPRSSRASKPTSRVPRNSVSNAKVVPNPCTRCKNLQYTCTRDTRLGRCDRCTQHGLKCSLEKTTARPAGLPRRRPSGNNKTKGTQANGTTETPSARKGRVSARAARKENESGEDGGVSVSAGMKRGRPRVRATRKENESGEDAGVSVSAGVKRGRGRPLGAAAKKQKVEAKERPTKRVRAEPSLSTRRSSRRVTITANTDSEAEVEAEAAEADESDAAMDDLGEDDDDPPVTKLVSARSTRARARAGGESISALGSGVGVGIGGRTRSMRRSGADESTFGELPLDNSLSPRVRRGRGRPSQGAITKSTRARPTSRPTLSATSRRMRSKGKASDVDAEDEGDGADQGSQDKDKDEVTDARIARLSAQMEGFMARANDLLIATADLVTSVKETQKELASLK